MRNQGEPTHINNCFWTFARPSRMVTQPGIRATLVATATDIHEASQEMDGSVVDYWILESLLNCLGKGFQSSWTKNRNNSNWFVACSSFHQCFGWPPRLRSLNYTSEPSDTEPILFKKPMMVSICRFILNTVSPGPASKNRSWKYRNQHTWVCGRSMPHAYGGSQRHVPINVGELLPGARREVSEAWRVRRLFRSWQQRIATARTWKITGRTGLCRWAIFQ